MQADSNALTRDSLGFSFLSALTVVSNAAVNVSIAIRFGAGHEADAFFLAYTIPGIVAGMLATTMPVVLIPAFVHLGEKHSLAVARRIISTIGAGGLVLWIIVACAGMAGGSLYVKALTPSSPADAQRLAVQIGQWMFAMVPLAWLSEFLRALLNSQRRFLLPLAGGSLANLLASGLILGLGKRTGIIIAGPGFILKTLLQIAVSAWGLRWMAKDMWPLLTADHRRLVWPVFRGLAIRFGGALLRETNVTVERFWSANLGTGLLSALSYAHSGANMWSNFLSASVATVLLPALSHAVGKRQDEYRNVTTDALRLSVFLTVPAAAIGIVLSRPICDVIFGFSDTSSTSLALVSKLLAIYTLRVPTLSLISVLLAPFYASEDVWTPVKHMTLMLGVNLALDVLLFPLLGIYGFPTAAILADLVSIARATWLQWRIGIRHPFRDLGRDFAIMLAGAGLTVLAALTAYRAQDHVIGTGMIGRLIILGVASLVGGVVYLLAMRVTGIPEAESVTAIVRQRLRAWRP